MASHVPPFPPFLIEETYARRRGDIYGASPVPATRACGLPPPWRDESRSYAPGKYVREEVGLALVFNLPAPGTCNS